MILGCIAFFYCGISIWLATDNTIGTWKFLIFFFFVFGFGRGAFENTNKAIVASYYKDSSKGDKDAAFASIYFSSGISAAISYATFRYMPQSQLVAFMTVIPIIALLCFHLSYDKYLYEKNQNQNHNQLLTSTTAPLPSDNNSGNDSGSGSGSGVQDRYPTEKTDSV